nr:hypothetical protein [Propionibacterium sp.]
MTGRTPTRGAAPTRSWTPLWAAAGSAVALTLAAFVPAMPAPAPVDAGAEARISRACFTTDAGAQLGVGSDAAGVAQAPLAAPTSLSEVGSGTVVPLAKEPVRLSAPRGVAFSGVVAASAATGADQGLALVTCAPARSEHWFTGVRSDPNATADLVLVNLDAAEAAVNVEVLGPDGPLAAPGARGVVVAGQSQRLLPLGPVVTAAGPISLHVTASAGRVAAVVRQRLFNGTTPLGADWVPATAAPAAEVVVPTVPGGAGARTLVVGNPGDRTAQVDVQVLGPEVAYAPVGVERVDIPPGATRAFELDKALAGKAVALRLRATREIVAAVEARTAGDVAFAPGAVPLAGPAPATIPLPAGVGLAVTVANPGDAPAAVEVTATDPAGQSLLTWSGQVAPGAAQVLEAAGAAVTVLRVTGAPAGVRVAVAAAGNVGTVPGLAVVALEGGAAAAPTVTVRPDPRAGG